MTRSIFGKFKTFSLCCLFGIPLFFLGYASLVGEISAANHLQVIVGNVVETRCDQHADVYFKYYFHGPQSGARSAALHCTSYRPGDKITVYVDWSDPGNAWLENPRGSVLGGIIGGLIATLALGGIVVFAARLKRPTLAPLNSQTSQGANVRSPPIADLNH